MADSQTQTSPRPLVSVFGAFSVGHQRLWSYDIQHLTGWDTGRERKSGRARDEGRGNNTFTSGAANDKKAPSRGYFPYILIYAAARTKARSGVSSSKNI